MTTVCDRIRAGIAQSRLARGMEPSAVVDEELVYQEMVYEELVYEEMVDEQLVDKETLVARVEDLATAI